MARISTVRTEEFAEDGFVVWGSAYQSGSEFHGDIQPKTQDSQHPGIFFNGQFDYETTINHTICLDYRAFWAKPNTGKATTMWVCGLGFRDVEIDHLNITQPCGAVGQSRDKQPSNWLTNKQILDARKCNASRLGYAAVHLNYNSVGTLWIWIFPCHPMVTIHL